MHLRPICVCLLAAGLSLGGCREAGDGTRRPGTAAPEGWTGPGPVLPPQRVRMWFGGDVMQHLPQVEAARRDGGFDYSESFAALAPRMRAADIAVVNFETTLTRRGPYTGYPMFRSPTALADALRAAGVDVALLANNHCCDGGADGLRTSIEELSRCGIRHTGAFADSADYRRNHPLYLSSHGVRLALVNYTYGTNGMPVPAGMIVNLLDTVRMSRDVAEARAAGVDFIVACLHWGTEYERRENASQRRLAEFLRRQGVDVIVGGHPHVVQPWVADSARVVLYSLEPAPPLYRRGPGGGDRRRAPSRRADALHAAPDARVGCDAGLPDPAPGGRRHTPRGGGFPPLPHRSAGADRRRAINVPNGRIKTTDRKNLAFAG